MVPNQGQNHVTFPSQPHDSREEAGKKSLNSSIVLKKNMDSKSYAVAMGQEVSEKRVKTTPTDFVPPGTT